MLVRLQSGDGTILAGRIRQDAALVLIVQRQGMSDAKHLCAMARGVRDAHSTMKVNVLHGVFQKDSNYRTELFLRLSRE